MIYLPFSKFSIHFPMDLPILSHQKKKRSIRFVLLTFFFPMKLDAACKRQGRCFPRCANVSKLLSSFTFWHSTRSQSQCVISEMEITVSSADGDLSLCSQCWTAYDSEEHQPKLLKCQSHPLATICLKCLHVSLFSSSKVHHPNSYL